jgi:hypothetical protein
VIVVMDCGHYKGLKGLYVMWVTKHMNYWLWVKSYRD